MTSKMPRELTNEEKERLCDMYTGSFPWDLGNGLIVLDDVHVENGRWNEERLVVFQFDSDERVFGITYWNGLTELQEGDFPGSYEANHDEFVPFEVQPVQKTVTTYEVV